MPLAALFPRKHLIWTTEILLPLNMLQNIWDLAFIFKTTKGPLVSWIEIILPKMSYSVFPLKKTQYHWENILNFKLLPCSESKNIFILSAFILKSEQDLSWSLGWELLNRFTATPSGPAVLSNHEVGRAQEVDYHQSSRNPGQCSRIRHGLWLRSLTAHAGGPSLRIGLFDPATWWLICWSLIAVEIGGNTQLSQNPLSSGKWKFLDEYFILLIE